MSRQTGGVRLTGYIAALAEQGPTRGAQNIYVNRRVVKDRTIAHAIIDAYSTASIKERSPEVHLFLEVPPDAVSIEVTAQQFMWNARYPGPDGMLGKTDPKLIDEATNSLGVVESDPAGKDDILTVNEITVPVNRTVKIRLKSKDVIHSFFLPNFRVKQDAIPGMTPEVVFVPTRTGNFEVACAELCGLAHYRMRAFFNVVTEAQYQDWLRLQAAAKSGTGQTGK